MKKEQIAVVCLAFLGVSYVLDYITGPIALGIKNPWMFWNSTTLATYPFTAVSVTVRALSLYLFAGLSLSFLEGKYGIKAIVVLVAGVLAELFAIQQLAVGPRTASIQWILACSLAGVLALTLIAYYVLKEVAVFIHQNINKSKLLTESDSPTDTP